MKRTKLKNSKDQNIKAEEVDPDHFTVFNLKSGWEKEMSDVWSPDTIKKFKKRQEMLATIPLEIRNRTKADKSYREGWVDAAKWIHQEMNKVFHQEANSINTDS